MYRVICEVETRRFLFEERNGRVSDTQNTAESSTSGVLTKGLLSNLSKNRSRRSASHNTGRESRINIISMSHGVRISNLYYSLIAIESIRIENKG